MATLKPKNVEYVTTSIRVIKADYEQLTEYYDEQGTNMSVRIREFMKKELAQLKMEKHL